MAYVTEAERTQFEAEIAQFRALIAEEHSDPAGLFDQVQSLIARLERAGAPVPADLREFGAELEGEVVEEFYDNLPV